MLVRTVSSRARWPRMTTRQSGSHRQDGVEPEGVSGGSQVLGVRASAVGVENVRQAAPVARIPAETVRAPAAMTTSSTCRHVITWTPVHTPR